MFGDILEIDDYVKVSIGAREREDGFNPCPEGAVGKVVGFSETVYSRVQNFGYGPGVFENRTYPTIRFLDGQLQQLSSYNLSLCHSNGVLRSEEEKRRHAAWLATGAFERTTHRRKLRELPELHLWEDDEVKVFDRRGELSRWEQDGVEHNTHVIVRINYNYLDMKRIDGSPMPEYDVGGSLNGGWTFSVNESDCQLVNRGRVWRWYHGERLKFRDLYDEARFFDTLGFVDEMCNPATNLYTWTKDEVLDAIRKGTVHGMRLTHSLFTRPDRSDPRTCAIRFRDEELGQRVAAATLEGFQA